MVTRKVVIAVVLEVVHDVGLVFPMIFDDRAHSDVFTRLVFEWEVASGWVVWGGGWGGSVDSIVVVLVVVVVVVGIAVMMVVVV